jgi:hypothetical protein
MVEMVNIALQEVLSGDLASLSETQVIEWAHARAATLLAARRREQLAAVALERVLAEGVEGMSEEQIVQRVDATMTELSQVRPDPSWPAPPTSSSTACRSTARSAPALPALEESDER